MCFALWGRAAEVSSAKWPAYFISGPPKTGKHCSKCQIRTKTWGVPIFWGCPKRGHWPYLDRHRYPSISNQNPRPPHSSVRVRCKVSESSARTHRPWTWPMSQRQRPLPVWRAVRVRPRLQVWDSRPGLVGSAFEYVRHMFASFTSGRGW